MHLLTRSLENPILPPPLSSSHRQLLKFIFTRVVPVRLSFCSSWRAPRPEDGGIAIPDPFAGECQLYTQYIMNTTIPRKKLYGSVIFKMENCDESGSWA